MLTRISVDKRGGIGADSQIKAKLLVRIRCCEYDRRLRIRIRTGLRLCAVSAVGGDDFFVLLATLDIEDSSILLLALDIEDVLLLIGNNGLLRGFLGEYGGGKQCADHHDGQQQTENSAQTMVAHNEKTPFI